MIDTDETLLDRLRAENAHEAWEEFFRGYATAIRRYAIRLGLDHTRADDVLQETMVVLMRVLPRFVYDRKRGKFRNFLLTITHRQTLAAMRRARRRREVSLPAAGIEVAADPVPALWQEALFEQALRNLRTNPAIAPGTLAVFEAYAVEGRPAEEVAREFRLTENAVYLARNRLLRWLRQEVEQLRRNSETEAAVAATDVGRFGQ